METNGNTKDQLPINIGKLTAAGVAALLGALLMGVAVLIGSNAVMSAVREWVNMQDVPPTESAKSMIRVLHNAALAGTTAGAEAWKNEIASTSAD